MTILLYINIKEYTCGMIEFDSSMMELLLYLYSKGGEVSSRVILQQDLKYSNSKYYRVISNLRNINLIEIEYISEAPPRTVIRLTEKGIKAAKKIKELIEILES